MAYSLPVGVVIMSNIFMPLAILELAKRDADCPIVDDDDPPTCKGRSHGMRPANIYNVIATAGAVAVTLLLPVVGAIVENSRFRKEVACTSLVVTMLIQGVQIFINRSNWFSMAVLQVFAIAAAAIHSVARDAYYPELSHLQAELNTIGSKGSLFLFATEVMFMVAVLLIRTVLDLNTIQTARLSQAISTAALSWAVVHIYGRLLRSRPKEPLPLREVLRRGANDLLRLYHQVRTDHPDMFRYLVGAAFGNAGMATFAAIAGVYLVETMGASVTEVVLVILLLLVVSAITSPLADTASRFVARRYGDAASAQRPLCIAMIFIGLVTALAPAFCKSGSPIWVAYIFALIWGLGFGQYYSLVSSCYYFLVPAGQETKFAGSYNFSVNILNWLPLVAFTVLYSATGSMPSGLWVMALFVFFGGGVIACVDMRQGRKDALAHGDGCVDDEEKSNRVMGIQSEPESYL